MRRQRLISVGVVVVASALGCGAWALAQERVRVEVTVPAVPSIGPVAPSQAPSELASSSKGVVYIGYRGAYHVVGAGQEGHAMYRDANNQFFANTLTYYGMSNGYWIASVNGVPDTYLAFQSTALSSDAPYFKVLIHTPNTSGYAAWDEATRGNAR
jgi:hypothetical protein